MNLILESKHAPCRFEGYDLVPVGDKVFDNKLGRVPKV